MPIQLTGEVINLHHKALAKLAGEFAELTRQAKAEKSHAYALGIAQETAIFLFELSMATNTNIADYKVSGKFRAVREALIELGQQACAGARSHNWVQRICFEGISALQALTAV